MRENKKNKVENSTWLSDQYTKLNSQFQVFQFLPRFASINWRKYRTFLKINPLLQVMQNYKRFLALQEHALC